EVIACRKGTHLVSSFAIRMQTAYLVHLIAVRSRSSPARPHLTSYASVDRRAPIQPNAVRLRPRRPIFATPMKVAVSPLVTSYRKTRERRRPESTHLWTQDLFRTDA